MNFSTTVCLRTPAQKNGFSTVRLQLIINRRVHFIPLGFSWPEMLWDNEPGRCLAKLPPEQRSPANQAFVRLMGDELAQKASDHNLVIGQALGQANEIAVRYRLSKRLLTVDDFLREYNSGASREDFLAFMDCRIQERVRRGQITELTRKSHVSTLNKLREFVAYTKKATLMGLRKKAPARAIDAEEPVQPRHTLAFCSITHKLAGDFDAWLLKEHGSCTNTRARRHRTVKAYLELARRDRISFENPYQYFSNPTVEGKWKAITQHELALLEEHYTKLPPRSSHRRMLQKFLFSCHCGLRLGDLKGIAKTKIEGQQMTLKPQKTYRYDEKDLLLPITKRALSYLNDSREENECEGFFLYTDQYTNRELRAIGIALGIEQPLHHHIGRETFATHFIQRGGKVEVLQKLMGHKKLSMTMKYVHVDEAMKKAEIDRLDKMDE